MWRIVVVLGLTQVVFGQGLVEKIQRELAGPLPEMRVEAGELRGEFVRGSVANPREYPATQNDFEVYVPRQYDGRRPACLLLKLDGFSRWDAKVVDELIAKGEMPVTIGVGLAPGVVWRDAAGTAKRRALRFDRSYEFDSMNDRFPEFVIEELLPAIEKLKTRDGRAIVLSRDANDRMAMGASTGGIGSFTLAWRRPDQFRRVYAEIGTFVSMRGGHEYPALIRKTEPKPIRVFLEDGSTDAWNLLFGSWFEANQEMDTALQFAGYDEAHAWGRHGHDARPGEAVLADVLRWMWRDYPAPVQAARSQNSTLEELTLAGEGWRAIPGTFARPAALAANEKGEVFLSDAGGIYRIEEDGGPAEVFRGVGLRGAAFGPDGVLYGIDAAGKRVVGIDRTGKVRVVARGIAGRGITVDHAGAIYVSEPGEHTDEPSRIWKIGRDGRKRMLDEGLRAASGLAFSPDGRLFFAAEHASKWVYSYVAGGDGTLMDKQPFDWLHIGDIANDSGAEDLAFDRHGNLYVATRLGVQICDQNGRVRAIVPLPAPAEAVRSLCFGGANFEWLYVTDGKQLWRRHWKVPGFAQWAEAVEVPSIGPG